MSPDILEQLLGQGAYSWVYSIKNDPKNVVKISKTSNTQLSNEMKVLKAVENSREFPQIVSRGQWTMEGSSDESYEYVVMERLGVSLEELMVIRNGRLGVATIKNISRQILTKIVLLHQSGFIHNDIKPENILFGLNQNRKKVYLIDFGLSQQMEFSSRGQQMFSGNISYASVGKLRGQQHPKNDYESLLWVCLWMLLGGCQWSGRTEKSGGSCECQLCGDCLNAKIRSESANKKTFLLSDPSSYKYLKSQAFHLVVKIQVLLRQFTQQTFFPIDSSRIAARIESLFSL